MGIVFNPNWQVPNPLFGAYVDFLNSVHPAQIRNSMWGLVGRIREPVIAQMIAEAAAPQGNSDVTVEQSVHQPQDLPAEGFELHFTVRDTGGRAFHMYINQGQNGSINIRKITYMAWEDGSPWLVAANPV
jgi:hypothetical protein